MDSDHIIPARERNGVHYKTINGKPGMIVFRNVPYARNEKMCEECFWTPWDGETLICKRCGGNIT